MGHVLSMFQSLFVVSQVIKKYILLIEQYLKCGITNVKRIDISLLILVSFCVTFGFFVVAADTEVISSVDFLKLLTLEPHINPIHSLFYCFNCCIYLSQFYLNLFNLFMCHTPLLSSEGKKSYSSVPVPGTLLV